MGRGSACAMPFCASETDSPPRASMSRFTARQMSLSLVPTAIILCESCATEDAKAPRFSPKFLIKATAGGAFWYRFTTVSFSTSALVSGRALPNASVKDFYSKNYVDLFINVSESEGVPVSIMEAMSAGVPCLATDVDGVSEIVRDGINGFLLPLSDDSKVISNALKRFYELTPNEKVALRKGAFKTWEQDYNADKNYESFIRSITAPINRV